jgi:hypothetical protein
MARSGAGSGARWHGEKKQQLAKRLTPEFIVQTIEAFNRGSIDAAAATELLSVSRSQLFRLRLAWMHQVSNFKAGLSGGNHHQTWPVEIQRFLQAFLPLQRPPNFQLVADELAARFSFQRDRKTVAAYSRRHFPKLVLPAQPIPKPRRRWERSKIGELWQHDSSIHPWWAANAKQTLLLTVDDHSRKYHGATFVPTDTTWNHFEHFRRAFIQHGRPLALYTDGLALFGHQSSTDGGDPRSEFQRALTALGISHLVAPTPQAKGKIERRFGTFQKRLLALLAFERITDYGPAQQLLDHELERQNQTVCRTTGLSPNDAWDKALAEKRTAMRPCSDPSMLDLHLAFHFARRCNQDHQIDFLGRSWSIAPTLRHSVTIIHHPNRQFWVVSLPPKPPENRWSNVLAKYSL